ncbi:unnamed protein product, partial [Leptidea sinapis]
AALALRCGACPPLVSLDLSFARGLDDAKLRGVLAPPESSRPGGGARGAEPSRLAQLAVLRLPGTDITDVAMRYVVQALPKLEELDVSSCARLTDALDLRHVPLVSTQAVIKFAAKSKHNLHVKDVKLVELRT